MIRNFKELRDYAKTSSGFTIAVPAAVDEGSLKTVVAARREGLAEAVLLGDEKRICEGLERVGGDVKEFRVVNGCS